MSSEVSHSVFLPKNVRFTDSFHQLLQRSEVK